MAASLKYLNPSTRYAEFFIDNGSEDIALLPTTTTAGQENLSTVTGVSQGSKAILTNSDTTYYRLSGSNVWIEITAGGGGGGSVTSYNQLSDKPQLNGVTLEGNLSSDDVDVQPESRVDGEQLIFDQNRLGFGI